MDDRLKFWGTYSVERDESVEVRRKCKSLANLLSQSPRTISKRDALFLAVNLASSLLQLHATPWLPENWCNQSIYFVQPEKVQQTYVISGIGHYSTSQDNHANFGLNPYLVELGIVLLELSERKLFCEWTKDNNTASLPDNVMEKAALAWEWFMQIYENMSTEYAIVVQLCLKSSFIPVQPTNTLADPAFRQAVYRDIVYRLERLYFIFINPI